MPFPIRLYKALVVAVVTLLLAESVHPEGPSPREIVWQQTTGRNREWRERARIELASIRVTSRLPSLWDLGELLQNSLGPDALAIILLQIAPADDALPVDDERRRARDVLPIIARAMPHAIGIDGLQVRIRQKRVGQCEIRRELLIGFNRIDADGQNLRPGGANVVNA